MVDFFTFFLCKNKKRPKLIKNRHTNRANTIFCVNFISFCLKVLENILKYAQDVFGSSDLVGIMSDHCRDPSLMVRKLIAGSLTDLLKMFPDNDEIIQKWVEGVFPLILDVEQKAAEKVQEVSLAT